MASSAILQVWSDKIVPVLESISSRLTFDQLVPTALVPYVTHIFFAYGALLLLALVPIYFGCRLAVSGEHALALDKTKKRETEKLSQSDALWFPIFGSAVLFGFYLLFTLLNKDYVNMLLSVYFSIFGCLSLTRLLETLTRLWLGESLASSLSGKKIRVLATQEEVELFSLEYDRIDVFAFIVSLITTVSYIWTKHWLLSNVFGLSFAMSAITLLNLDSFATGMVLLMGLFVYDIFWVFGTNVMVTVAKNFDAPIKMLWPRDLSAAKYDFALLGLGDIVIPGIYIALCARFDYHQARRAAIKAGRAVSTVVDFPMPYFISSFIAYILGLLTTFAVMHTFKAAQPALLYLSPAGVLSVLLTALVRGELAVVLAYAGEEEQGKKEDKKVADPKKNDDLKKPEEATSSDDKTSTRKRANKKE